MRRRFIKVTGLGIGGAALLGTGLTGCDVFFGGDGDGGGGGNSRDNVGYSKTNPVEKPEFSFANTVTLDVSPGDNLDAALQEAIAEDTLVRIPAGTYEIATGLEMPEKAGLEGMGEVTLRVAPDQDFYHIDADSRILYVDNLHYDLSEANNGTGVKAYVSEKGYVGHVCITGLADANPVVNGMAFAVRNEDGLLMVEEFVDMSRGTGYHTNGNDGNGRIGMWSGNGYHNGLAYFKNCTVVDAANNALYASRLGSTGRLHVNGGFYLHSYGAGLRTGGNGTILENAYIEIDMRKSQRDYGGGNPAIRWEVKDFEPTPTSAGTIRTCDILMVNGKMNQAIRLQRSAAQVTVKDCRVYIEEPETAPLAIYGTGEDNYKYPAPDDDRRIFVDGLEVSGPVAAERPSIEIGEGRDGSEIKNSYLPGGIQSESELITENNVEELGTPPAPQDPPDCGER